MTGLEQQAYRDLSQIRKATERLADAAVRIADALERTYPPPAPSPAPDGYSR